MATEAEVLDEGQPAEEVVNFCLQWNLNTDAEAKLLSLPPEVQLEVISNFAPRDAEPGSSDVNGKLIKFAVSIDKQFRSNGGIQHRPSAEDLEEHIAAFLLKWNLNPDAEAKMRKLKPSAQQAVMAGFAPPPHMTDPSGKFIMYASSVEKYHIGTAQDARWQQNAAPQAQWQQMPQQYSGAKGGSSNAPSNDDVMAFAQQWGLNGDAVKKLFSLDDAIKNIVLSEFNPGPVTGAHTDLSGKLIMFASSIEKRQSGMQVGGSFGKGKADGYGIVGSCGKGKADGYGIVGGYGKAGSYGKGKAMQPTYYAAPTWQADSYWNGSSMSEQRLWGFCQHWGLNEDAQQKLFKLSPDVQEAVMAKFQPRPHQNGQWTDLSGKFIMFAASLSKGLKPEATADPVSAFAQHWGLNADAQKKLWSLAPEVQQAVIKGFAPPPQMMEVSGKFIMFASSLEKGEKGGKGVGGKKRPFGELY